MTRTIGIFGLGLIGKALTARIHNAGWDAIGHDPDQAQMDAFATLGGTPVDAAKVWQADFVLASVFDTDQLSAVIDTAPAVTGKTLVATSTCDPSRMDALADKADNRQITLVEAPLSGTCKDLAEGNAVFLVAGPGEDLDWLFSALGRAHYHLGAIGNGNRAKLAVNLVLGLNRAALAEGLVFAKAIGLDQSDLLTLLQDTAAASAVMPSKGPKMVARDFSPLGKVAQSAKDFDLIARTANSKMPLVETYRSLVAECIAAGEGDLDNSAVLLAIERAMQRS